MSYPAVLSCPDGIQVKVSACESELSVKEIEFILDFNSFQEIIGIEILNLKLELGDNCLNKIKENINSISRNLRYSYDEESDSFYLKLVEECSLDQEVAMGTLTLNAEGEIVEFSVKRCKTDSRSNPSTR